MNLDEKQSEQQLDLMKQQIKAKSVLFPSCLQTFKNNTLAQKKNEIIFNENMDLPELFVFGTNLSEKLGIFVNMMSKKFKVTVFVPIFEVQTQYTQNKCEQDFSDINYKDNKQNLNNQDNKNTFLEDYNKNLFGEIIYTGKNIYIDQLDIYVGIHESYINNAHFICCHNFNIFKRKNNEFYYSNWNGNLNEFINNQQQDEDSAELFLQRTIILKSCCEKLLLQKRYQSSPMIQNIQYPQYIVSMDSYSILSSLFVQNYFNSIGDYTSVVIPQELSQSDLQYKQQRKLVMLFLTNYRNIFITKNDIKGYKINDYNYCIKLLNYLHIDINDITDKYVYNRLFPLRLALFQIQNIVTDENTEEQIDKSQLYNWIQHDDFIVSDNMQGIVDIYDQFLM